MLLRLFILCSFFHLEALANQLDFDTRQRLEQASDFWQQYGDHCYDPIKFPAKNQLDGSCDDGDSVLFNGLLCSTGFEDACQAVRASLDSSGQWWRSPRQVGGHLRTQNSFSRDMTMGALLYLVSTQDREAAQLWLNWIQEHKQPLKFNGISLGKVSYLCHDDKKQTCLITPAIWESFAAAWIINQIPPHKRMREPYSEFGALGRFADQFIKDIGFDWADLQSAQLEYTKPGYEMHLHGVDAYLLQLINRRSGFEMYDVKPLTRELTNKQPKNLFFKYLHHGSSNELADELLAVCPNSFSSQAKRQWAWERADESEAWKQSMGWDCFFLARLLLQESKDTSGLVPSLSPSQNQSFLNQRLSVPAEEAADQRTRQQRYQSLCQQKVEQAIASAKTVLPLDVSAKDIVGIEAQPPVFDRKKLEISLHYSCYYQIIGL